MKSHKFIFIVSAVVVIIIIGIAVFLCEFSSDENENLLINSNGGYSFSYPVTWKASINQYNTNNSLFGPDADSASGLGGVEVFPNQTSIDEFLQGVDAQYSNKADVVIDGVSGMKTQYTGFPVSGEQVVLLRDGNIYNIYINSKEVEDIDLFNQIVSSFEFTE